MKVIIERIHTKEIPLSNENIVPVLSLMSAKINFPLIKTKKDYKILNGDECPKECRERGANYYSKYIQNTEDLHPEEIEYLIIQLCKAEQLILSLKNRL